MASVDDDNNNTGLEQDQNDTSTYGKDEKDETSSTHQSTHHSHQQKEQQSKDTDNKKKRLFSKELRCMMYGFGDDQNPYTETVDMLEDLVIKFIGHIALDALEIGRTGRVTVEDVMYLVRRDPRKYARVKDLLSMNEELKRARKAFDEVEYVQKKKKLSKMNGSFKSITLNPNGSSNSGGAGGSETKN